MATFQCPHCSRPISGQEAFCPHCGGRLSMTAPAAAPVPNLPAMQPTRPSAGQYVFNLVRAAGLAVVGLVGFLFVLSWASRPSDTASPTERPRATVMAAWRLVADSARYTDQVRVGGAIVFTVEVSNAGTAATPGVELQFDGLDDNADIVGCVPTCEVSDLLGVYAAFPGVPAGTSREYEIEWVATDVGAARWSLCIYDDDIGGELIDCYEGTTVVR